MSQRRKTVIVATLSVLVLVSIVVNAAILTSKYYQDRVLPNTVIGSIDLGGKRQSEAKSLISQKAVNIVNQQLTLQLNETTVTASPRDLGVTIDESKTIQAVIPTTDQWAWTKIDYWRSFFTTKNVTLAYTIDETKLTQALDEKFPISENPKDAAIIVRDGNLEIEVATAGITIDIDSLKTNLISLVEKLSVPENIPLDFKKTMPGVSDVQAKETKNEIIASLGPVHLTDGSSVFRLEERDFFPHIVYSKENNTLAWSIPDNALQELVRSRVANRFNIKMRQRTIMSNTNEVTDAGQEGREVLVRELASQISQSLVTRTQTSPEAPITIPFRSVSITERVVHPSFVLGVYTGRYIMVNLAEQRLFAIEGNTKVAEFRVSTGKWSTPTPRGTFYIKNKHNFAFSRDFNLWLPLWNALATNPDGSGYRGYGIHGLPCFDRDCVRREGARNIGTPVSAGCIRLPDEGARFVFDWAPVGTPVVIQ